MSNETASQEKQFKHIFRGRGEWKITNIFILVGEK